MKLCIRIIRTESGEYMATCTSLPGCCTRGKTQEQARQRIDEAIRGYLASIGEFVPDRLLSNVQEVHA